jgi:imidazolonepropionase-like amidohydrolase
MDILPRNFDRINARRESAAILAAAGVTISFADGGGHTHNARNITQSAGNAVANGLSWDDALRAITLAPAEIFGVASSVGSIEPGKEADIVIWPDDPLELTTYPEQVLIKGESISMTSRQTLLRDRYLKTESGKPPAYRR